MNKDICLPCDDGILNIRVGAIIMKDGNILMAGNNRLSYLYSVGGRIKFGETAEEAVMREVYEETGVKMEIDRLGFVQENFFRGVSPDKVGKPVHEICFFFYMKVPPNFEPANYSFAEGKRTEYLKWVDPNDDIQMFPTFFKTELQHPADTIKHIVDDRRCCAE